MATKTLTKEQWATIENELSSPWGSARLLIDGYQITLEVRRVSKSAIRYEIAVFVNGKIKVEYIMQDCEERRRFYRPIVKKYHNAKRQEQIRKLSRDVGKKTMQKWAKESPAFDLNATFTVYSCCWGTFKPLKRFLEANNDSIELAEG